MLERPLGWIAVVLLPVTETARTSDAYQRPLDDEDFSTARTSDAEAYFRRKAS
jgi:hypothetical protein